VQPLDPELHPIQVEAFFLTPSSDLDEERPVSPRDWLRAGRDGIHEALPAIDGLLCPPSMHGDAPALALYERAEDALPALPEAWP
jgi:hypothetical protein